MAFFQQMILLVGWCATIFVAAILILGLVKRYLP